MVGTHTPEAEISRSFQVSGAVEETVAQCRSGCEWIVIFRRNCFDWEVTSMSTEYDLEKYGSIQNGLLQDTCLTNGGIVPETRQRLIMGSTKFRGFCLLLLFCFV